MEKKVGGLYVITDTAIQNRFTHLQLAELAINGGADVIQLREKKNSTREILQIAFDVRKICSKSNVIFIVNDRVDIAMIVDADGVHLGEQDLPIPVARKLLGPEKIIGGTASNFDEAKLVEQEGADYIGFGHIFDTKTKFKPYEPRGLDLLKEVCKNIKIPVIAIGGINYSNAEFVIKAGASGIAVTSAVCCAEEPKEETGRIKEIVISAQK
jgi:thiamine-phosphate pyrophosphorylase